jgi:hypothetical protein
LVGALPIMRPLPDRGVSLPFRVLSNVQHHRRIKALSISGAERNG